MSVLVFQHHSKEGPAALGQALQRTGHRLKTIDLYDGQTPPVDLDDVHGLIVMGGPMNVDQAADYPWLEREIEFIKQTHEAKRPIIGICLGAQLIATALGGKVAPMETPEVGWGNVKLAFPGTIDTMYGGITWDSMQFHLHGQQVTDLPPGAAPLAGSKACRTQAFKVGFSTYGFQYHFEWDDEDIRTVLADQDAAAMIAAAGTTADAILEEQATHYPGYRRQGDRLCETMANMYFPASRRKGA